MMIREKGSHSHIFLLISLGPFSTFSRMNGRYKGNFLINTKIVVVLPDFSKISVKDQDCH